MAYTALPDRRISYDNDGTVVGAGPGASDTQAARFAQGVTVWVTGADLIALNNSLWDALAGNYTGQGQFVHNTGANWHAIWFFFPEQREVTAMFWGEQPTTVAQGVASLTAVQGSNDSTNGVDGTWETASFPSGTPTGPQGLDTWRAMIRPISFTGGKRTIRTASNASGTGLNFAWLYMLHIYGEKVAGQTPNDIIYIDHDTTPGVEYAADEDFGDRPLATTVVRQFRVKNVSGSLTANSINIQCNDADFAISTDNVTWVVTINIASLAPGAESPTMYIRNTTPAIGSLIGPRFARIVSIVGSWT